MFIPAAPQNPPKNQPMTFRLYRKSAIIDFKRRSHPDKATKSICHNPKRYKESFRITQNRPIVRIISKHTLIA